MVSLLSVGLGLYTVAVILLSSKMGEGSTKAQQSVQMISFDGGFHIVNSVLLLGFVTFGILSIAFLWYFSSKKKQEGLFSYDKIYFVTFLGIIARSLISGWGLWLYMGKNVPLIFYWLPRFVTPMFLVPITAFAISGLGYILKKYTK